MKFRANRRLVAHTATKLDRGTALSILRLKKISMIGMLLPAPERPAALLRPIKKAIIKMPDKWSIGASTKGMSFEIGFISLGS